MRIGILEEDSALAEELVTLLTGAGYRCYLHTSAQSLISFLSRETVDLLLLDSSWEANREVIQRVRSENARYPFIVVLVPPDETEIVVALNSGADGCALKAPLQRGVLLARIASLFRRSCAEREEVRVERFGAYTFHKATETVHVNGKAVTLSARKFALGLMLFRAADRTLSRSYIFEALWGSDLQLQTRTLDTHISKLRTKLDLRGENGFRLATVYGLGYRLETVGNADEAEDEDVPLRFVAER